MIMRLLADEWSAAVARIGACPFRRVRRVFETLGQAPFRDRPGFALALPAQAPIRATTTGHPCQTKDLSCSRIGACALRDKCKSGLHVRGGIWPNCRVSIR